MAHPYEWFRADVLPPRFQFTLGLAVWAGLTVVFVAHTLRNKA